MVANLQKPSLSANAILQTHCTRRASALGSLQTSQEADWLRSDPESSVQRRPLEVPSRPQGCMDLKCFMRTSRMASSVGTQRFACSHLSIGQGFAKASG